MPKTNKSKGVYASHRKNQREKILEVAANLFIKKGLDPVTMADIASASRLTRATIYIYFNNRKEITFGIFKTVISNWRNIAAAQVLSNQGAGFQRIEKFLTFFAIIDKMPAKSPFRATNPIDPFCGMWDTKL
jgi:AcrR family transcriptional regulator